MNAGRGGTWCLSLHTIYEWRISNIIFVSEEYQTIHGWQIFMYYSQIFVTHKYWIVVMPPKKYCSLTNISPVQWYFSLTNTYTSSIAPSSSGVQSLWFCDSTKYCSLTNIFVSLVNDISRWRIYVTDRPNFFKEISLRGRYAILTISSRRHRVREMGRGDAGGLT